MRIAIRNEKYTYANYITWPEDERWELIDGEAYDMTPAPSTRHQSILLDLAAQIYAFLKNKECKVFVAPFDVRLPEIDEDDSEIKTVVQPDIVVICDPKKIDDKGCRGVPDFVIEIISPSTASKDCIQKMELYERHGVAEYWIMDPFTNKVFVRVLDNSGKFGIPRIFETKDTIEATVLPGLTIKLSI